ncbi:hypothetical protein Tco_1549127 [Tanacetum coccineum]
MQTHVRSCLPDEVFTACVINRYRVAASRVADEVLAANVQLLFMAVRANRKYLQEVDDNDVGVDKDENEDPKVDDEDR